MDTAYAALHAEEDRAHWWFRGRRAVILAEMERRLPPRTCRIAELGCGSGGMLEALARFGSPVGVESDPMLREAARRRGLDARKGTLPEDIPLGPERWDVVCLFDVLEHLEDDAGGLEAAVRLLVSGGWLFVTVPAYPWLWSRHDEWLGHRRRYTARGLRRMLGAAGLSADRVTYFNTLLAPPIVLARVLSRAVGRDVHDLRRPPAPVNRLLAGCFAAEARLLRWGAFPFGISVFGAARKS